VYTLRIFSRFRW